MFTLVLGTILLTAAVIGRSAYLIKTSRMPGIEDIVPNDPRSGRF